MAVNFETTLVPGPAYSGGSIIASQALTVSTAAVAFTDFDESEAQYAIIDVVTSPVRVRWDGTAPTSTVGHKMFPDYTYIWTVRMFNNAQFIRDTTASSDAALFASPLHS